MEAATEELDDRRPPTARQQLAFAVALFARKCRGGLDKPPPRPALLERTYSSLGAFAATAAVAAVHSRTLRDEEAPFLIAAWGATATLLFCVPKSPFAQESSMPHRSSRVCLG